MPDITRQYDVAVIGAGIVGVATALHLLKRGKKVVLIDRKEPGQETSYGNSGLIGNSYVVPFGFPPLSKIPDILLDRYASARIHYRSIPHYLPWLTKHHLHSGIEARLKIGEWMWPLVRNAVEEHLELAQGTDASRHIHNEGRVQLYRSEASFAGDAFMRQAAKERGVPFEILDAAEFNKIEPAVRPVFCRAVRWTKTPRVDNPGALVAAYAQRFAKEGGRFEKQDVTKLTLLGKEWRIETGGGAMSALNVVICMGPWATDILKPLGYHFSLASLRGYHQHFAATNNAKLSHAIFDLDRGYGLIPMEQGIRLTTGVEFAFRDAAPTPVQISLTLPSARDLFPLGVAVETTPWMGSRPCFADSLPVIGPAAKHTGLWFNFGHGHAGLTMGPASGRLLAEMLTGAPAFCDPSPYRAARFGC